MRLRRRTLVGISFITATLAPLAFAGARASADDAKPAAGPTAQTALAADRELARALGSNDAAGIARILSDDWAVIAGTGGVGEGKDVFPEGIRTGVLTHKTYETSEPRVRIYGNVAVVTSKVDTSGTFNGKPFHVVMRQTDVMQWRKGGWKIVLTHETMIRHV
jgi:ketosteroid isomerase-like protein